MYFREQQEKTEAARAAIFNSKLDSIIELFSDVKTKQDIHSAALLKIQNNQMENSENIRSIKDAVKKINVTKSDSGPTPAQSEILLEIQKTQKDNAEHIQAIKKKVEKIDEEKADKESMGDIEFNIQQVLNGVTKDELNKVCAQVKTVSELLMGMNSDLEIVQATVENVEKNVKKVEEKMEKIDNNVEKISSESIVQQNNVEELKNVTAATEEKISKLDQSVKSISTIGKTVNDCMKQFADLGSETVQKFEVTSKRIKESTNLVEKNLEFVQKIPDISAILEENNHMISTISERIPRSLNEQLGSIRERIRNTDSERGRVERPSTRAQPASGWKDDNDDAKNTQFNVTFNDKPPAAKKPRQATRSSKRRPSGEITVSVEKETTSDSAPPSKDSAPLMRSIYAEVRKLSANFKNNPATSCTKCNVEKEVKELQSEVRRLIRDKLINGQLTKIPEVSAELELIKKEIIALKDNSSPDDKNSAMITKTFHVNLLKKMDEIQAQSKESKSESDKLSAILTEEMKLIQSELAARPTFNDEEISKKFTNTFEPFMDSMKSMEETRATMVSQTVMKEMEYSFGNIRKCIVDVSSQANDLKLVQSQIVGSLKLVHSAPSNTDTNIANELKSYIKSANEEVVAIVFNGLTTGQATTVNNRPRSTLIELTRSNSMGGQMGQDDNVLSRRSRSPRSKSPSSGDKTDHVGLKNVVNEFKGIADEFTEAKFSTKAGLEKIDQLQHTRKGLNLYI